MPSLAEIGKHLSISRARAGQLKNKGMPTSSLEAATRWRERQHLARQATNGQARETKKRGRPRNPVKPAKTGDSLQDALQNAILTADAAFTAYQDAVTADLTTQSMRLSEHSKALDARLKAEKIYREELERRSVLVNKGVMMDKVRHCMEVMLRRLRKLPAESGPQCNEQEPIKAVAILQQAVDEILTAGQQAIRDL